MDKIKNFAELIEPNLEENKNSTTPTKVATFSTKSLVQIGENWGSEILAVAVTLTNGKTKQLVAKLNPPSELFKKIFNISIAFKKEAEFLTTIVPILHNFQKENNLEIFDAFPKSYGHRYSLSQDKNVFDDDACLVMENLKFQGYVSSNRYKLFDFSTSEYIVRMLAQFHAIPIAIKKKKPQTFEKIKTLLPLNLTDPDLTTAYGVRVTALIERILQESDDLKNYAKKVIDLLKVSIPKFVNMDVVGREPFNTITHNDAWMSNIMLKYDENGKPIGHKLVDYQLAAYGNPANDLLLFIHTSCELDVIENGFNQLVDCYFEEFIQTLKKYKVDVDLFRKDAFLKEVELAARGKMLYQSLFLTVNIYLKVDEDFKEEDFHEDASDLCVSENCARHLKVIVRNWLSHNWVLINLS